MLEGGRVGELVVIGRAWVVGVWQWGGLLEIGSLAMGVGAEPRRGPSAMGSFAIGGRLVPR